MLYRVIDSHEIKGLLEAFMDSYDVIAPKCVNGSYQFGTISSPDEVVFDYPVTSSSIKKYLLPPTETLLNYDASLNTVESFHRDVKPLVIFGVHPCDINAINRLDMVFRDGPYPDPYYCARREATIIIGMSCMPTESCFCHVMDSDEARTGYDLFLTDMGDTYFVSISGIEAANILEQACNPRLASEEDRIAFRRVTRKRNESFNPEIPHIQEIAMLMDAFHFDPFWAELGGRCLSCSACSSVCPTCFCFDIVDKLDPSGKTGSRERVLQGCTTPSFATVAGGHNFRNTSELRVRHRMYHKLNGFLANHDYMLCVGCGRCVHACKADINPIQVLKFFQDVHAEGSDNA